ncbi:DinB family protein [Kitasatospora griseola]|uniref:hypothetical protein n=1 Tax=Kitasatospora griseola TaxID=2064 RepID=UPI00380EDDF0
MPGWSRGNVLTHPARNTDGGRWPLSRARTGVAATEEPSPAARDERDERDERIEAGAGRSAAAVVRGPSRRCAALRRCRTCPSSTGLLGADPPRSGCREPRRSKCKICGPFPFLRRPGEA